VAEHVPADVPVRQVVAVGKPFHGVVELAAELAGYLRAPVLRLVQLRADSLAHAVRDVA
jgi:Mg-chelatase subunit ChlD